MRTAWFGWGVPLLKRHWSLRWGECPHCGDVAYRPSYDASRMAVLFGLPVLPVGKVRVHEECAACERSDHQRLADWEQEREEQFEPALEKLSQSPSDPGSASRALELSVRYGEAEEFAHLSSLIEKKLPGNVEVISQLAWCHGYFVRFDDAKRLYRRALEIEENSERREVLRAYEELPLSESPHRPSRFFQSLRFLLLPLLLLAVGTGALSHLFHTRASEVYVVNGLDRPYSVMINDQQVTLVPHGHQSITVSPGSVRVAPAEVPETLSFTPYHFELARGRGGVRRSVIINPDKVAVISWEELVYQDVDSPEGSPSSDDQFVLHVGEGFYLFEGITDHFEDPPSTLEMHSEDAESYRHVVHHLSEEDPVSLCTLLLGQGEMELARDYCRALLSYDPDETGLLPFLQELAPDQDTLAFLEARLADRPVRFAWHRHYLDLGVILGQRAAMEEAYSRMVQQEPNEAAFHFLLGKSRSDTEQARADYRRAAQQGSAEALYELCQWASGLGNFQEALAQIQEALQAQPENAAFLDQEADLLLAVGNYGQLIPRFRRRIDDDPLDQQAAMVLAGLFALTGKSEEADRVTDRFIQAVALDGALVSEETAPYRELFARVQAQWALALG